MLEGSMCAYLPQNVLCKRWINPWHRSYSPQKKVVWETDMNYCRGIRNKPPYNSGRRLLDLMDLAVFDFLQGICAISGEMELGRGLLESCFVRMPFEDREICFCCRQPRSPQL